MKPCRLRPGSIAGWKAMLGRHLLLVNTMIDRERLRLETLERALAALPAPPPPDDELLASAAPVRRIANPR